MSFERDRDLPVPRFRRGGRAEARALATLELHLQAMGDDPLEPSLDRDEVRRVLDRLDDRLTFDGQDEWIDASTRSRVIVADDRILVRTGLPDESREALAQRLDRAFDLAFDIASPLRLDVVDPQLGSIVSRSRYEQQFQRFLDAYYTRARTAVALASRKGWTELTDAPTAAVGDHVPAIETAVEDLPSAIWGRAQRDLGVLEFAGEKALAALARLDARRPFVAIVPPEAQPGDDAALLRIRRYVHPVSGLALAEVATGGLARIRTLDRDGGLRLSVVPHEK